MVNITFKMILAKGVVFAQFFQSEQSTDNSPSLSTATARALIGVSPVAGTLTWMFLKLWG